MDTKGSPTEFKDEAIRQMAEPESARGLTWDIRTEERFKPLSDS